VQHGVGGILLCLHLSWSRKIRSPLDPRQRCCRDGNRRLGRCHRRAGGDPSASFSSHAPRNQLFLCLLLLLLVVVMKKTPFLTRYFFSWTGGEA
jgi:hypothetical protein